MDTVRDQPVPPFAHVDQVVALLLAKIKCGDTGALLDEADNWKPFALTVFTFGQASVLSYR
ncbi:hypothetical protein [Bradyrhizobium sp. USDA 3364]